MPYGFIVLIGSTVLVAYFTFAAKASWISKAVICSLFIFSFASFFGWIGVNPLVGLLLLVVLSTSIIFYRRWQDARSGQ